MINLPDFTDIFVMPSLNCHFCRTVPFLKHMLRAPVCKPSKRTAPWVLAQPARCRAQNSHSQPSRSDQRTVDRHLRLRRGEVTITFAEDCKASHSESVRVLIWMVRCPICLQTGCGSVLVFPCPSKFPTTSACGGRFRIREWAPSG